MREFEETHAEHGKIKIKHKGRFIVAVITAVICLWMIVNFVIAIATGQKFSILGNGFDPVKNIVVAGVDEGGYRTDLLMLCQVNRRDGEINILQIPRDTRVNNKRGDRKINSAYYSGFDTLKSEIEQVTGLTPDGYIMLGFDGFTDVIDAMGGVRINVPMRMYYTDPVQDLVIDLKEGNQKLSGEEAQMFMRFRQNNDGTGYVNGDVDRIEAQKTLYSAVFKKMLSPIGLLRVPAVFGAIKENCETDLSGGEIFSLMRDVAATGRGNIFIHSLPGGGRYIGGGSYFVPSESQTKALIDEHFIID